VGKLALGVGVVFLRPLAAHHDDRADDGVPPEPAGRHAQLVEQDDLVARRVRLDREFVLALGLELTC
jgi:hypothetical protein